MSNVISVQQKPSHTDLLSRAVTLHQVGDLDNAEALYRTMLASDPQQVDALYFLGTICVQKGRWKDGTQLMEQAIAIRSDYAEAYNNLSVAFENLKQHNDALASCEKAIAINPAYADAYYNRGNSYHSLKQYGEAVISYNKAIVLQPDFADAYNNRGNSLQNLHRYEDALADYDKAITLNPSYADAHNNRGFALYNLNRHESALLSYDKAIILRPDFAEAYINKGNTLQSLNRYADALTHYNKAISINPEYAEAYWNKGVLKLLLGEYKEGWELYEWRWRKRSKNAVRVFDKPLWLGKQSLAGKTILLHAEQGLGDTIQFCRYASLVEALDAKVILEVPASLVELVSTLKGSFKLVAQGDILPAFDFHCPLLSLPLAFGTLVDTIPAQIPYLFANSNKHKFWQARLGPKSKPRIGLAWSGATQHKNDHNRRIPLSLFSVLHNSHYEYHTLQKEIKPTDYKILTKQRYVISHAEYIKDFSDTAALMAEMDIVLSVDTSIAHLAGALGKPLWLLLPFVPDYRWLTERDDSPWYPTARLFRQTALGDWGSVMAKVAAELNSYFLPDSR